MEGLTESARQSLVWQGLFIGAASLVVSLSLLIVGSLDLAKNSALLHFTSLFQLTLLEIVCGLCSLTIVLFVWWIIISYRNKQLIVRSKYLDEKMSYGLVALILPILLSFASFIVNGMFLLIKTESSSLYDIRSAMMSYGTDSNRKVVIDKLQISLKCCGGQGFEDWFSVNWQNLEIIRGRPCRNVTNRTFVASSWDSVPFSCCGLESDSPCIHHQLQLLGLSSLNSIGCAEKIDQATYIFLLTAVVLYFASTTLMTSLLYIGRKLQTSAKSAVCKGCATAPGVWWLLSPPGHSCGKATPDGLPLIDTTSCCTGLHENSDGKMVACKTKGQKIITNPALFIQKPFLYDEETSDEWLGESCSTSNTSIAATSVANKTMLASEQTGRDTAVHSLKKSHNYHHKPRSLYRS